MLARIRGIKTYRSRGKSYIYHRATGTRLVNPIGSPAFFAELAAIQGKILTAKEKPGTWGALVALYKASPRFAIELKPRTRSDYNKVLDWLYGLRDMPLDDWSRPFVVQLRDKAQAQKGRRFGNYVLAVISLIFGWGMERGEADSNPASKIKKIRRPKGEARRNRAWKDAEWQHVTAKASKHVLAALYLFGILGWRKGEAIRAPRSARTRTTIERISAKSGKLVRTPVPKLVASALDAIRPHDAITLLVNSRGRPWSDTGINSSLRKIIQPLLKAGKVEAGLTIHGLRHTAAKRLRELGYHGRAIADMLGQETEGVALEYAREADMEETLRGVVRTLDRKGKARTKLSSAAER